MTIEIGNIGFETSFEVITNTVFWATAFIYRCERDTSREIGSFSKIFFDITEVEDDVFKYFFIWPKLGHCSVSVVSRTNFFNGCDRLPSFISLEILETILPNSCFCARWERIDDRGPNSMETSWNLVSWIISTEFSSGMEDSHNRFEGRNSCFWMNIDWDSSTIILYLTTSIVRETKRDVGTVTSECFIDRIIDDFLYEVITATCISRTDVHAGTLADGLETFEDLDLTRIILGFLFFFSHKSELDLVF